jgi:hypothetical protein
VTRFNSSLGPGSEGVPPSTTVKPLPSPAFLFRKRGRGVGGTPIPLPRRGGRRRRTGWLHPPREGARQLPKLVIARSEATRQSIRTPTQAPKQPTTPYGLPRASGPRNDGFEGIVGARVNGIVWERGRPRLRPPPSNHLPSPAFLFRKRGRGAGGEGVQKFQLPKQPHQPPRPSGTPPKEGNFKPQPTHQTPPTPPKSSLRGTKRRDNPYEPPSTHRSNPNVCMDCFASLAMTTLRELSGAGALVDLRMDCHRPPALAMTTGDASKHEQTSLRPLPQMRHHAAQGQPPMSTTLPGFSPGARRHQLFCLLLTVSRPPDLKCRPH